MQELSRHFHFSDARSPLFQPTSFQKLPFRHHQVAQRTGHKLPLDDAELVFHLRPNSGLRAVLRTFLWCQLAVARSLRLSEIPRRRRYLREHGLLAGIGGVPPIPRLVAMQKIRQNPGVVDIGRRGHHRMDQLAATVHTNMRLLSMPKCHCLPLRVERISGSRTFVRFFVKPGASMMLASTIVPRFTFSPLSAR